MKKFVSILLMTIVAYPLYTQTRDNTFEALTTELTQLERQGHIVGFSVAIVNEDSLLYTKGFGFSDVALEKKYTEHTIQNIASISKTAIGLALLKAQELGKLDLDDPINEYLSFEVSNPYFPEKPIAIRHLASHTSSITDPSQYDDNGYVLKEENNEGSEVSEEFRPPGEWMDYREFLEKILSKKGEWYKKKTFLKQPPGSQFEYTNIGAGLAALVLEGAVGRPFNEFTHEQTLKPLDMTGTGWSYGEVDFSKHSKLYTDKQIPLANYRLINYPDGGLITSATDLGKYLRELIKGYSGKGTLLSAESYQELFRSNLEGVIHEDRNNDKYNDEYGMGIFMGLSAQNQIGHTGGDPGVSSLMFFDIKSKIGKLLIVNTDLDSEGVKEFIDIWKTLEAYETKL